MPNTTEIDAVCPDTPLAVVHTSLHFLSLNSMAIKALGVTGEMDGVDTENGRMTGLVQDPASLAFVMPQIDRMISKESILKGYYACSPQSIKKRHH